MPSQDFKRSDRIADLLKVEISQVGQSRKIHCDEQYALDSLPGARIHVFSPDIAEMVSKHTKPQCYTPDI